MSQLKYNSYKNIFFDLDGTLTDPYEGITNSIIYSLRYYPEIQIPEREMLKSFIGPPLFDSYRRYFRFSERSPPRQSGITGNIIVTGAFLKTACTVVSEICCPVSRSQVNGFFLLHQSRRYLPDRYLNILRSKIILTEYTEALLTEA